MKLISNSEVSCINSSGQSISNAKGIAEAFQLMKIFQGLFVVALFIGYRIFQFLRFLRVADQLFESVDISNAKLTIQ